MTVYWLTRRRTLRLVAAGVLGFAMQARADDPATVAPVRRLSDALLGMMKTGKSVPFQQRFGTLAPVVDQVFDLATILEVSVGPTWSSLPPDQHTALLAAFRRYTVASYVNSFDNYTGQRFDIDPSTRALPNGDQVVGTRIVAGPGDSHRLDYVMHQGSAGWQVVDVLLDGTISRVAVQRSDFRRVLMSGGAAALMAMLQQKTTDLSGGAAL